MVAREKRAEETALGELGKLRALFGNVFCVKQTGILLTIKNLVALQIFSSEIAIIILISFNKSYVHLFLFLIFRFCFTIVHINANLCSE